MVFLFVDWIQPSFFTGLATIDGKVLSYASPAKNRRHLLFKFTLNYFINLNASIVIARNAKHFVAKQAKRCECVARSRFGRAVGEVNPANAVRRFKIAKFSVFLWIASLRYARSQWQIKQIYNQIKKGNLTTSAKLPWI